MKSLSRNHALLALAVVFVWGTNFVVVRVALEVLPPLLMAALRFTLIGVPLVFFLPRPRSDAGKKTSWHNLAGYGICLGVGQFGLLFIAMNGMISPALASLVLQTQVFFTIGFAMLRQGERLVLHQIVALALAAAGIGVIVAHSGGDASAAGVALTVGAALGWAVSNQIAREAGRVNTLAYAAWSSLFAVPPLFALAFLVEGWGAMRAGLAAAGLGTWAAVLWQSMGNNLFGYGVWTWLLQRYPAATISPLSLLVPVFGFSAATLVLGEPLQGWKLAAAALVMAGLALNLLWPGKPKMSA